MAIKIKAKSKQEVLKSNKTEEFHSFIEDADCLGEEALKQLFNTTYLVMQLKRFSREELKDILSFVKHKRR